ncbi:MAG TPA: hypothetical protein VEB21_09515 [Terriglobales bacterium]|nr:hypothetical protein [Terriglobales bacterium]
MEIVTATATSSAMGPLRTIVENFVQAQGAVLAKGVNAPSDWAPMAQYLDVDRFKRVGAYLEELSYEDYCKFLTGWAAGGTRFEMTEFHSTEVGNTLFQEIEERHYRGDTFIKKNVIAVYRFNSDNKIYHLDIYEQAKESGRWIAEAAEAAMAS